MRLITETKLDYKDILIVPQRSDSDSRSDISLEREFKFKYCLTPLKCIPIIAANMYNTGSINMCYALGKEGLLTALHKYTPESSLRKLYNDQIINEKFFLTIGQSEDGYNLFTRIAGNGRLNRLMLCIDVANGYRESFIGFIKRCRNAYGRSLLIMAGNVTTPEMAQELVLAGADIVKIGIGPGSVCETRRVTGVGYPMVSAIIECGDAVHGLGAHICADGGCKEPSDICKAFCCGADFVMLGGMFAGTDECEGEWIRNDDIRYTFVNPEHRDRYPEGKPINHGQYIVTYDAHKDGQTYIGEGAFLKFFGMSSYEAMEKFGGLEKKYRASEGKCELIPNKGPVENVVKEIIGGLVSCCTYIGSDNIKHMHKRASIVKVN